MTGQASLPTPTPSQLSLFLDQAKVPEHSVHFMQAMSGGRPFMRGGYLFLHAEDWLLAVGYPIHESGPGSSPENFAHALQDALDFTQARDCWAICATLPKRLQQHRRSQDQYLILPADAAIPSHLQRLAQRAAATLRVEEESTFTAAHRRLWVEFTSRVAMPETIRELYARTESILSRCPNLSLLNAWDQNGNLAACLLLDSAPRPFLSYILGAHSRAHPTPYASDLLFLEMIRLARKRDKGYLHLGLGVNPGIRRFKEKWGATPLLAYEMAQWRETAGLRQDMNGLMQALASSPSARMTRQELWNSLPPQRPFRLLWKLERNGRTSWIGGSAHFFRYSFEKSLRRLIEKVDTVMFEGPLDRASLDHIAEIGQNPEQDSPRLIDALTEEDVRILDRAVNGPRGFWARLLDMEDPNPVDVRSYLADTRHWYAFFSLWTHFLRRHGWHQSVDLEAWSLAHEMGKDVRAMETITEQIAVLESIPVERILRFFRRCGHWKKYIRRNMRAYLKGDLEAILGTCPEFPTRTCTVINRRDILFMERMLPRIDAGRCAVFVGSVHMFNLRNMLAQAGFSVRKLRKVP